MALLTTAGAWRTAIPVAANFFDDRKLLVARRSMNAQLMNGATCEVSKQSLGMQTNQIQMIY
jgi:hypothetical protein